MTLSFRGNEEALALQVPGHRKAAREAAWHFGVSGLNVFQHRTCFVQEGAFSSRSLVVYEQHRMSSRGGRIGETTRKEKRV